MAGRSGWALSIGACPADVGRRVTVRHTDPSDGRATDVVGRLAGWAGGALEVARRDGTLARIAEPDLLGVRVVAPELSAYDVEALAEAGWPAELTVPLGPWTARWDHGITRRANSARVSTPPPDDLPDLLDRVTDWYAARGSPAMLALPHPWTGDDELDRLGWRVDAPTLVLTAPAPDLAARLPPGPSVELRSEPDADWLTLVDRFPPEGRRLLGVILARAAERTFAYARGADGDLVGIGRASLDRRGGQRWCCLTNLRTAPHRRRSGVARAVIGALAGWAVEHGATTTYLQVEDDNGAARRLYDSLGFGLHHRYVYRLAPRG